MDQTITSERPDRLTGDAAEAGVELIRLFWRRKAVFAPAVALLTAVSIIIALQIPPRYTAVTRLMLNPLDPIEAAGGSDPRTQGGLGAMRAKIYGEIEVLRSERLIKRTALELGLVNDPEFNAQLRSRFLAPVMEFGPIAWLLDRLNPPAQDLSAAEQRTRELSQVIDQFRRRLTVRPPGLSNVIAVEFESRDPRKASHIANIFAQTFIADRLERKFQVNIQARDWLDNRLAELRDAMIASERTAAEFQAVHKLSDTGGTALVERQIAEVSRQLMQAKAEHAERSVRLNQVVKVARLPDGIDSVKEIRNSRGVQRMRDQEATLVLRAAELETRFGERHPKMINLRAEIANLRSRIEVEKSRIVEELKNEVRVAKARVAALDVELNRLEGSRAGVNRNKVQLRQLLREATANRKLYEAFLTRFKATQHVETLQSSGIEIVSPSKVPLTPSYPLKPLIVGFGFLVSVALGSFLILLLERLDSGFRTSTQVERVMQSPVLGIIPRPNGRHRNGHEITELITQAKKGSAPYVEAIRSLRTSLLVSNLDRPPKIVLVASALSGEGKTSLSVSIARLAALSALEGRVILIDCDLRKPAVAEALGIRADKGLIHLFSGQSKLDDIVTIDPKTGLHVIPAAPGTPNPPELLNSTHMRLLLEGLAQHYDTIILDSPALSEVSDARVLARLADATVFVVQRESTPRQTALESFKLLRSAGARIAGVVMQKVNVRKTSSYGYLDAGV